MALEPGTAVVTADGSQFATVERVLSVPSEDVFDGIVVNAGGETRFVDRDQVGEIYQRAVVTTLTSEQAGGLPGPDAGTPEFVVDPAEGTGQSAGAWWKRTFGKLGWHQKNDR